MVVQAGAYDVVGDVRRETRLNSGAGIGEGTVDGAVVDIEIFDLTGPFAADDALETGADCPAGLGRGRAAGGHDFTAVGIKAGERAIGFDSADRHLQFIAEYKLNFTLVADPDGKIIEAYDVKMPMMAMSKRVSFLIGLDGKIVHVTNSGNPDTHLAEMKAAIAGLKKN